MALRINNIPNLSSSWVNLIIPFAVIWMALDAARRELFITHFTALFVHRFVQPSIHFQSRFGRRVADHLDNDLGRLQRPALPVRRDVAEQPVFDLVPLARPGWVMTHFRSEEHTSELQSQS